MNAARKNLTTHQTRLLERVWNITREMPYLSVNDVAKRLGMAGAPSLIETLERIESKGYVTLQRRGNGHSHIIQFTPQGIAQAEGVSWQGLPLLGEIAAGPLAEAVQNDVIDYIDPGNALPWKPGDYLLKVAGDSMEERILKGDMVLIRPGVEIPHNHVAAALVWDENNESCESSLKCIRYLQGGRVIELKAYNEKYEPMRLDAKRVSFAGAYRGLLRHG